MSCLVLQVHREQRRRPARIVGTKYSRVLICGAPSSPSPIPTPTRTHQARLEHVPGRAAEDRWMETPLPQLARPWCTTHVPSARCALQASTGKVLWKVATGGYVLGSPAVSDGGAVVVASQVRLLLLAVTRCCSACRYNDPVHAAKRSSWSIPVTLPKLFLLISLRLTIMRTV